MFPNFPSVCQNIFACLKLSRPRLVIVHCYITSRSPHPISLIFKNMKFLESIHSCHAFPNSNPFRTRHFKETYSFNKGMILTLYLTSKWLKQAAKIWPCSYRPTYEHPKNKFCPHCCLPFRFVAMETGSSWDFISLLCISIKTDGGVNEFHIKIFVSIAK